MHPPTFEFGVAVAACVAVAAVAGVATAGVGTTSDAPGVENVNPAATVARSEKQPYAGSVGFQCIQVLGKVEVSYIPT
jgi:hypothetical protein